MSNTFKTMASRFPGKCITCKQYFKVDTMIDYAKGVGARHHGVCPAVTVTAPAPVVELNQAPLAAFLKAAQDRGLKFPKARFLAPHGGELRLSLAGSKSKAPGAIQVKVNDTWIGRINPDGAVVGHTLAQDAAMLATLGKIATNPAAAAKEYGALMGRCSYCNLALTDEGSVEVGYGPICAKHYGLPHKAKGAPDLLPVRDLNGLDSVDRAEMALGVQ